MPPLRIGIDLGSRAVKVAWTTASRREGLKWHKAHLPVSSSEAPKQLHKKLRELLLPVSRARYDTQVLVAVSNSHVRQLVLEIANLKHLPEAVQERLPGLFPFELARSSYQYRLLSQQPANGKLICTIQTAACDLEGLRGTLEACWRIGWIPSHAYPTALALAALVKLDERIGTEAALLVEFGARHTVLALVADGRVSLAREASLGSEHLTEALMNRVVVGQQTIQLSWEQAEALKCQVGIPSTHKTPFEESRLPLATHQALIQPVLEQWLAEIRRTIAFGVEEHPEAVPQKILLSGGGSQLHGLDGWLAQQLSMPVQRLSVQPIAGEDAPVFAVACGLLMAEGASALNLIPKKSRGIRRLIRAERMAIKGLLLAIIGLWLAIAGLIAQQTPLKREILPLEERWLELKAITTLEEVVAAQVRPLANLTGLQAVSVDWLVRLAQGLPHSIRLTELLVSEKGEVRMAGQARSREQTPEAYVSELVMRLEQAGLCQAVHLAQTQRNSQNPALVDFSLTCQRLQAKNAAVDSFGDLPHGKHLNKVVSHQ